MPAGKVARARPVPTVIAGPAMPTRALGAYSMVDRLCDLLAEPARRAARAKLEAPGVHTGDGAFRGDVAEETAGRDEARQLLLHDRLHPRRRVGGHGQPVEDQPLDVEPDLHARAPVAAGHRKSASLMGRSSLRSSARAPSSTRGIGTGGPPLAARKAALSATLWMCPPVRLRRASRSRSSPTVGVRAGKTFCQMAFRSAIPGNEKFTTKRSRRRNAVSSAL